jgi:hypothetical protein
MNINVPIFRGFLEKPDGRRKAGRSKLRWLASTENDLKSMVVKRLRNTAEDIAAWAISLRTHWLSCKDGMPMKKKRKKEEEDEKEEEKNKIFRCVIRKAALTTLKCQQQKLWNRKHTICFLCK